MTDSGGSAGGDEGPIIKGLQWVLQNVDTDWGNNDSSEGIDVMTMSFGRGSSPAVGNDQGADGNNSAARLVNNSAEAAGEPIPLGGGMPMTGWAAADGIEFKRAQEMACDEINAMGGILGRPLVPVVEDTGNQGADNIIPAMQTLVDRHGVHAIINGYNSGAGTAE